MIETILFGYVIIALVMMLWPVVDVLVHGIPDELKKFNTHPTTVTILGIFIFGAIWPYSIYLMATEEP